MCCARAGMRSMPRSRRYSASTVAEPLLTGLGAGGTCSWWSRVASRAAGLLRRGAGGGATPRRGSELIPITISFGDAIQVFNIGAASVGRTGCRPAFALRRARFGRMALPISWRRPRGWPGRALCSTPAGDTCSRSCRHRHLDARMRQPSTPRRAARADRRADSAARARRRPRASGAEGAARSTTAISPRQSWMGRPSGAAWSPLRISTPTRSIDREPIKVHYRGREVLTNPPPLGGRDPDCSGALAAGRDGGNADGRADRRGHGAHPARADARVPGRAWTTRSSCARFFEGRPRWLHDAHRGARPRWPGVLGDLLQRFGSGAIVSGTGVHLNNMLGEQDLYPLGFHRHPPGRRLPSMMAPTDRHQRRCGRARAGERGVEPHPVRDPADHRPARSTTGCAAGEAVRGPARPLRGRRRVRRAGGGPLRRGGVRSSDPRDFGIAISSSAGSRPSKRDRDGQFPGRRRSPPPGRGAHGHRRGMIRSAAVVLPAGAVLLAGFSLDIQSARPVRAHTDRTGPPS